MKPREAAKSILRELEEAPDTNETSRRELFVGHLGSLFPEFDWQITEYAVGAEQPVKFTPTTGKKAVTGRIDTRKGSLIIEYKTHVRTADEQKETERQLREYISGTINTSKTLSISKCISTDIVNWHEYRVGLRDGAVLGELTPEDVVLSDKRSYAFSSKDSEKFVRIVKNLVFESVPLVANSRILVASFGLDSEAYKILRNSLDVVWKEVKNEPESKLALGLWSEYVENCFVRDMKPDENTYLDHVYLLTVSRLIAGAALASLEDLADENFPKECLTGEFFSSGIHRVEHFVEEDFFRWMMDDEVQTKLRSSISEIHHRLQRLDFRSAQKLNLLQELYQQIMPPEHKVEYGAVFTPTWLVQRIVDTIPHCENTGIKVLDPACGTGSFLRTVIQKKRDNLPHHMKPQDVLNSILGDVVGLDINPISVVIAKTTIMLSLADLLRQSDEPVHLPIYFCDSLFLPKIVDDKKADLVVAFDGSEIQFPAKLFSKGTMDFDSLVNACSNIAADAAKDMLSSDDAKVRIQNVVDGTSERLNMEGRDKITLTQGIKKLVKELEIRIRSRRNNVWAFVLKNTYRPSLLKASFDIIISNPPWLALSSFPAARYRAQLKSLIQRYKLEPAGQSRHHMEISTLFAVHCCAHYLKEGGKFAFVLPRVILNGDHHDPFRQSSFHEISPLSAKFIWDLERVEPLFGRPACVLFGQSDSGSSGIPLKLPRLSFHGNPTDEIKVEKTPPLVLVKQGPKSSFETVQTRIAKIKSDNYEEYFRQGADLMPRTAVIVDVIGNRDAKILSIQTSEEEKANINNKPPWKNLDFRGTIERQYIFTTLKSDRLLPFVTSNPSLAALPVMALDNKWKLLESSDFARLNHNHAKTWFNKIDRKVVNIGRKPLASWLKRNNKLVNQSSEPAEHLVLFGAGGTNIAAAIIDTRHFDFPFINDQTLYAYNASSEDEAWYVCGMLNSSVVNEAIKSMQPKGKFGEQHIHKLPLRLIPKFDSKNKKHVEIAKLARNVNLAAKKLGKDPKYFDVSKSLASRRRSFGDMLRKDLVDLNNAVSDLLGN